MGAFHSKTGRTEFSRRMEFCLVGQIDGFYYTSTIHESKDIIACWHDITQNGEASKVLSVVERSGWKGVQTTPLARANLKEMERYNEEIPD